jgi:hypothetical protein
MLKLLFSRTEFRPFLSLAFIRGALRRTAELTGMKILPMSVARWFLNRFYRHSNAPAAAGRT